MILPAILVAAPAMAQDAEPFTGPSIVAIGGVDHSSGGSDDPTGFVYGGAVTYDLGSGSLRYGAEAEVTGTTTGECQTSSIAGSSQRNCYHIGRDLYVGGRLGMVVAPNLMLYGKAGYTNVRIKESYDNLSTPASPDQKLAGNSDGYRLGAGMELDIGKFLVRTEYRYSDYDWGGHRHQGTVGLGFRF
ncbi:outer membrane protein [Sphingomonas sp. MS122]|uniref:outer membrane protein n=1 Tax=Sphingomonas sp. MS122 TaxID=3412683 RepID=UPI003C2D54AF